MDDSELFNLTVVELRSLCNEKGLEAAKLRKKQIVELLVDNGVSEIPENLRDRSTPRKSVMTPVKTARTTRRSALTPQKNQLDANITVPTKLTPRNARYQRFQQLAKLKESRNSDKENENEGVEIESSNKVGGKSAEEVMKLPEQEEKEEEFSDAKEHLPNGTETENAEDADDNAAKDNEDAKEKNGDTSKENDDTTEEHEGESEGREEPNTEIEDSVKQGEDAVEGSEEAVKEDAPKENEDALSASSFTTAASPADSTSLVDKGDDEGSATPRKSRKRWSTSPVADFDFARKSNSPAALTPPNDEKMGSPPSPSAAPVDGSKPPSDTASNKDSPQPTRLTRQRTFTVETPASKSTPGVSNASKVGFKASKTPNFKKIHERNQAKFEDIAAYSARRRDRMRQLLSTTREIRAAGAASRDAAQTPKTPLRTVKASSQMETPASERKILSNKVRSNRRFELLMKSRGLPIDGESSDDH